MPDSILSPTFFPTAAHFRAWLNAHSATTPELLVGFHKVASGVAGITWPESVQEALCVGWIDGVRKRIDDNTYSIRFTPRRAGSIWSAVNVKLVEQLTVQGRMQQAGLDAFALRKDHKTSIYAYEQAGALALTSVQVKAFKKDKAAWLYWQSAPPSYVRVMTYWVNSAKQEATQDRRLSQLVDACGQGKRILK